MRRPERGISEEVQTPTSFLLCYRYGEPIDLILIINTKTCIYYFKFVSYASCFIISGQTPFLWHIVLMVLLKIYRQGKFII